MQTRTKVLVITAAPLAGAALAGVAVLAAPHSHRVAVRPQVEEPVLPWRDPYTDTLAAQSLASARRS